MKMYSSITWPSFWDNFMDEKSSNSHNSWEETARKRTFSIPLSHLLAGATPVVKLKANERDTRPPEGRHLRAVSPGAPLFFHLKLNQLRLKLSQISEFPKKLSFFVVFWMKRHKTDIIFALFIQWILSSAKNILKKSFYLSKSGMTISWANSCGERLNNSLSRSRSSIDLLSTTFEVIPNFIDSTDGMR